MAEIKLPVSLNEDYYDGPLLSLLDADGRGVAQFDADYPDAQKDALRVVDTVNALLTRAEAAEAKLARVRALAERWRAMRVLRSVTGTVKGHCGHDLLATLDGDGEGNP